jgi:hypothetical protein
MNIIEPVSVQCPYCGEMMDLEIDLSEGNQEYTEDCPVCCKPVTVKATVGEYGIESIEAKPEDD